MMSRPLIVFPALVCALAASAPVRAGDLTTWMLQGTYSKPVRCTAEEMGRDRPPGSALRCARFRGGFERFRESWDEAFARYAGRHPEAEPLGRWRTDGSGKETVHRRTYADGDRELIVIFDNASRRLSLISSGGPSCAPGGVPEGLMWGGHNGASNPEIIRSTKADAVIPELARRQRIGGRVVFRVVVRADGRVTNICVIEDSGTGVGLEHAALEAVRQWRYRPATFEGRPIDVLFAIVHTFEFQ